MSEKNKEMPEGDRRAWRHAIQSGALDQLTDEERQRMAMVLCYTEQEIDKREGGTSETDIQALWSWAAQTRISVGLLDGLLAGDVLVRMKDGEPCFSLSPRGAANARAAAERAGLPVDENPEQRA